jgi:hypothetical protein
MAEASELLIEVFSNLSPFGIYACRRAFYQLNELIINSQSLQYISRTTLSGVFDPLETGLSLPDRLDALERWEAAWMEIDLREPDAIIDVPVFAESEHRPDSGFLSRQYFIVKLATSPYDQAVPASRRGCSYRPAVTDRELCVVQARTFKVTVLHEGGLCDCRFEHTAGMAAGLDGLCVFAA